MSELIVQEREIPRAVRAINPQFNEANPSQLLQIAVQQGADLAKLEKLMDLQDRWEKNEARKAFVVALTAFKASPPSLLKNKHVKYENKTGGFTEYDHATLDHVSVEIGRALAAHGLSHRWDIEQMAGGVICVTCVLTHALGHSERVPMQSLPDNSGGKNSIQAIGSTVTYLQRYTLLAATGQAVRGQDDDGKGPGPENEPSNFITDQQVDQLRKAAIVAGKDDAYICNKARIDSLADMQPSRFQAAMNHLKKITLGDEK